MPKPYEERQIGSFRFRSDTNEVIGPDGNTVALRPQTSRVLEVLLERPDQVVTKDELISLVWPDTHVTDDSLVQCISEIRKSLGAEGAERLITVPKKGYRLAGTDPPRDPRCAFDQGRGNAGSTICGNHPWNFGARVGGSVFPIAR